MVAQLVFGGTSGHENRLEQMSAGPTTSLTTLFIICVQV